MNCCICRGNFWNVEFFWGKLYFVWYSFRSCFWVCMPYGICSVPFMVLCTICIIHVVPMMLYWLAYFELLFFSLVGLTVCGCDKVLQICRCRLIGVEEFLFFWENLDWLLPDILIFPTIEGGSLYLRWIFPLWSFFECLDFSLYIVLSVITWGN